MDFIETDELFKLANNTKVFCLNIRNTEVAPQFVINVTKEQAKNCKYFLDRGVRSYWLQERNKFIDYVIGFYGKGELYGYFFDDKLVRDDVMFATNAIDKSKGKELIESFDSVSREFVRDYLFLCKKPKVVEYEVVRDWFNENVANDIVEHKFLIHEI